MPALVQICIVIVTIGLLAIALLTVRMMTRFFNKAAEDISQLTRAVRESVAQIDLVTHDARELVASLRDCVPPVQRVVDRFETVGQRTADLSSALLEELEVPVYTATAVARGVRAGADHLLRRLMHRLTHRHSPILGGLDHE
jgi:uncharacterized protein YoxC